MPAYPSSLPSTYFPIDLNVNPKPGIVVGEPSRSTTSTDGFVHIPTCAGTPTGVPTLVTGTVPMVFDTTNNRLYYYRAAAWHYIGETA